LRVAVIHNPTAGDESHSREGLQQTLESAGHDVVTWRSTKDDDWPRALTSALDLAVVAGGDGTVRKVFKRAAGTGIPVTVLPLGSANNIATALGFGTDVAQLVRGWEGGRRRPYDLGLFTAHGREDRFVESVGGGVFADLLARAEERDDDPGGEEDVERGLRMLRGTVVSLAALRWGLEADGQDLSGELLAVEALNVSETGPNVPLAPEADSGDGLLDLVVVAPDQRDALISYLDDRLEGSSASPPRFSVRRCRRVELRPPPGQPLRLDDELLDQEGEPGPIVRATITLDSRVEVIVPARA
jgi:diacylglycerol kinase (ATP)